MIEVEALPGFEQAVAESVKRNISGKRVTPLFIARLSRVTVVRTLTAHLAPDKHKVLVDTKTRIFVK